MSKLCYLYTVTGQKNNPSTGVVACVLILVDLLSNIQIYVYTFDDCTMIVKESFYMRKFCISLAPFFIVKTYYFTGQPC